MDIQDLIKDNGIPNYGKPQCILDGIITDTTASNTVLRVTVKHMYQIIRRHKSELLTDLSELTNSLLEQYLRLISMQFKSNISNLDTIVMYNQLLAHILDSETCIIHIAYLYKTVFSNEFNKFAVDTVTITNVVNNTNKYDMTTTFNTLPVQDKPNNKTHLSLRGKPLVYSYTKADKPVITVEITSKWYNLFVVNPDDSIVKLTEDFTGWIDHCPMPDILVEYAEKHNYYVDEQSLEMMLGRIYIEKDYTTDNSFEHTNIISYNN